MLTNFVCQGGNSITSSFHKNMYERKRLDPFSHFPIVFHCVLMILTSQPGKWGTEALQSPFGLSVGGSVTYDKFWHLSPLELQLSLLQPENQLLSHLISIILSSLIWYKCCNNFSSVSKGTFLHKLFFRCFKRHFVSKYSHLTLSKNIKIIIPTHT